MLRASRGFLVLHGPRILSQKKRVEAAVERLPDAALPVGGHARRPRPAAAARDRRLDRRRHRRGHPGRGAARALARELPARTRPRRDLACGRRERRRPPASSSSATSTDALARARRPGVRHARGRTTRSTPAAPGRVHAAICGSVLETLSDRLPDALILMANLPIFIRFELLPGADPHDPVPPLPQPGTRRPRGDRPRPALDDHRPGAAPPYGPDFFASDDFHPSLVGLPRLGAVGHRRRLAARALGRSPTPGTAPSSDPATAFADAAARAVRRAAAGCSSASRARPAPASRRSPRRVARRAAVRMPSCCRWTASTCRRRGSSSSAAATAWALPTPSTSTGFVRGAARAPRRRRAGRRARVRPRDRGAGAGRDPASAAASASSIVEGNYLLHDADGWERSRRCST